MTGYHFILDIESDDPVLNNGPELYALLNRAAAIANMQVIGGEMRCFEPQGVTAFLVLAESHISAHTSPEVGKAFVDVFTCGDWECAEAAVDWLAEQLGGDSVQRVISRGTWAQKNEGCL